MPEVVADHSLPEPWLALYDSASGLRYYWNPKTNVTTYNRPDSNGQSVNASTSQQPSYTGLREVQSTGSLRTDDSSLDPGAMSAADYRKKHDLTVTGDGVPDPFQTFEAAGFPRDILDEIKRAGFQYPTPIQSQAWPVALTGRDLVAIAKTGSGKTCGFLLPGLMHIKATRKDARYGPTVLVLAPTRELAMQIKQEADKFGRTAGVRNTCVYGGAPKHAQLRDLQYGVEIVIATPGRLNDFLESNQVRLGQVSYLVLDEADRMLDMGFEPQIQKIVRTIPRQRQTLFFSATWPREVKSIAAQFVTHQTVHIFVGGVEEKLVANKAITQYVYCIESFAKNAKLQEIIRSKPAGTRIIIFCSTKRMCDQLSYTIGREFRAAAIHGDKKQSERDYVLAAFKEGRMPILVATDVAARGLDIPNVAAVINYDFPNGVEDYIHRIGRTGRAGATGEAHTFFASGDAKYARELCQVMTEAGQMVSPELQGMAARGGFGGGGRNRWGNANGFGGGYGGRMNGGAGSSFGFGNANMAPIGNRYGNGPVAGAGAPTYPNGAVPAYTNGRASGRSRSRSPMRDSRGGARNRRSASPGRSRSRSRSRSRYSNRRDSPRRSPRRGSPTYGSYGR